MDHFQNDPFLKGSTVETVLEILFLSGVLVILVWTIGKNALVWTSTMALYSFPSIQM